MNGTGARVMKRKATTGTGSRMRASIRVSGRRSLVVFASSHPTRLSTPAPPSPLPSHHRLAAAACAAACAALVAWAPPAALAQLPEGKRAVSSSELVQIIKEDFIERKYLVTGNLTKEVYSDHCHFADSRDDFGDIGLGNWTKAVNFLFDGQRSKLALTGDLVYNDKDRTITFTSWRQVDVFNLPGAPHTPVFTGHTVLTLDPVENLVVEHIETWDEKPDDISGRIKFFDYGFDPPGFSK